MIRLRAVGPCNIRRIEQFAILTYATEDEASDINLCTDHTRFPSYDDDFYLGVVSVLEIYSYILFFKYHRERI